MELKIFKMMLLEIILIILTGVIIILFSIETDISAIIAKLSNLINNFVIV